MKKIVLSSLAFALSSLLCMQLKAQSVGIGTTSPTNSAQLDVTSTNKGLLVPRVNLTSTSDASTIPSPAKSLLVYNTNTSIGEGYYYNSGTTGAPIWVKLLSGASAWSTTGNTGTDTATNFIGTTSNMPIRFKINNVFKGQLSNSNVYLGDSAGVKTKEVSSTSGSGNVGIGNNALFSNIQGYNNIAIGSGAMLISRKDNSSVAIGDSALLVSDDPTGVGNQNVAIGSHALLLNQGYSGGDGYGNTAVGAYSLAQNNVGHNNTSVGYASLFQNTNGGNNTAIGAFADIDPSFVDSISNSTVIGANASVSDSNSIVIGDPNINSIGGFVGWSTFSDGRYKKDIQENVKGLDFILKLRPVSYHYNFQKLNNERIQGLQKQTRLSVPGSKGLAQRQNLLANLSSPNYQKQIIKSEQKRYTGLIAQEVEATANNVGYDFSGVVKPRNSNSKYSIRYAEFVVPLIKAVQEQQKIIDDQNKKIDDLNARLLKLEQKLQ